MHEMAQSARLKVMAAIAVGMMAMLCLAAVPFQAHAFTLVLNQKKSSTQYLSIAKYKNTGELSEIVYEAERFHGYYLASKEWYGGVFELQNVKNLKRKNISVVDADSDGCSKGCKTYYLVPKGPGKASLSYTYKGKKYTRNFVFKKYSNPVKSLKIGKKQLAKKFKSTYYYRTGKTLKGKLQVKAAKNWKLQKIEYNGKKVKNGAKVTYHKNKYSDDYLVLTFKNKKTKVVQQVTVGTYLDWE